tara:strand:- start:8119 stop:10686 length:2568 start_codon:yes stop_codon:yes gene_type:complete
MLPVEIRYLNIVWSDPETVIKLETSYHPLKLESIADGWWVETITFPKVHHYIGVCINEGGLIHSPYFLLAGGQKEVLMPLKVPGTDKVWWIQNGQWHEESKRYLCELYRTTGRVDLIVQNQRLTIENNTSSFSVTELEYYLADFKNSLWMLILDNNSVAKAGVLKETPNVFSQDVLHLFHCFIDSVEKIVQLPGMILSETQGKLPKRSVKPVPRTFREYAIRPNQRQLTSRKFEESFDTPENRFIYYTVKRVLYLLRSLGRLSLAQNEYFHRRVIQEKAWIAEFGDKNTKKVDSKVYDNEIVKLATDLKTFENEISTRLISGSQYQSDNTIGEHGTYKVMLGGLYGYSTSRFFVEQLDGENFRQKHGYYLVINFLSAEDLSTIKTSLQNTELEITGWYEKAKKTNSKEETYFELNYLEVSSILIVTHPLKVELDRLKKGRGELELKGWIAPLTRDELRDLSVETEMASQRINLYETLNQELSGFLIATPKLQRRLQKLALFFKANKVKVRETCPNTMVFIQNPSYAGAKSHFKRISSLNGLDESILNSLMLIDDIGLVNVANLYEKWCLLQIIKVLNQVYRFEITSSWQSTLINAVLEGDKDIEFQLLAPNRQQRIVLTYEKTLASGKRPDFVIDLFFKSYSKDSKGIWIIDGEQNKRLVLDAKFRGNVRETDIDNLVSELYTTKNYSEDENNQVFIIHSSQNNIENRTSPLSWGTQCDYGQSNEAHHRYGSVFLSPTLKHGITFDHLQRLMGMFLQRNNALLQNEESSFSYWHNSVCIGCGNESHETLIAEFEPTKAGSERWIISCAVCSLRTIKTICYHCHTDLYKNGSKWTYHRTRAEQTSNVVCPECEKFL